MDAFAVAAPALITGGFSLLGGLLGGEKEAPSPQVIYPKLGGAGRIYKRLLNTMPAYTPISFGGASFPAMNRSYMNLLNSYVAAKRPIGYYMPQAEEGNPLGNALMTMGLMGMLNSLNSKSQSTPTVQSSVPTFTGVGTGSPYGWNRPLMDWFNPYATGSFFLSGE